MAMGVPGLWSQQDVRVYDHALRVVRGDWKPPSAREGGAQQADLTTRHNVPAFGRRCTLRSAHFRRSSLEGQIY
jgi:hypothetical protein